MKLLLITLLTLSIQAQSSETKKSQKDPSKEKVIVSDVKKSEIEGAIKDDSEFKRCKGLSSSDQAGCIANMVKVMTPEQLEAIGKDLGESAFTVEGGKRSEAIKNFMKDRISKLIYGDKKKQEKGKAPKVVGHGAYREIYKSQLGKNMLLDVSTYCLENIGSKVPESILNIGLSTDKKNSIYGFSTLNSDGEVLPLPQETKETDEVFVTKIVEYVRGVKTEYFPSKTSTRNSKTIKALKKASLSLYASGDTGAHLAGFCRNTVIKLMCERYKCNSTDHSQLEKKQKQRCHDDFEIAAANKDDKNGQIACALISKLESYKKTFAKLKDQKDFYDKNTSATVFEGVTDSVDLEYDDVNKVTSIGSKELTNEVDEIKNIKESAKEIDEKCLATGDTESTLCKGLASSVSEDDEKDAQFENDLANAIYEKKVDLARDGGEDELKKFLEENNLLDKYGGLIGSIDEEEIAKIIKNDYKVKKNSVNDTMMAKLRKLRGKKNANSIAGDFNKSDTIKKKKEELESDKEYIETMFEYNNIVTSYLKLQVTDAKGKIIEGSDRSFAEGKDAELKAIDKYKNTLEDKEEIEEYEKYKDMFSNNKDKSSSSNSSGDSVNFIGFLDSVLGISKEEKDK